MKYIIAIVKLAPELAFWGGITLHLLQNILENPGIRDNSLILTFEIRFQRKFIAASAPQNT